MKTNDFFTVDSLLQEAVRNGTTPAAVIEVGRGEEILYRGAYGRLSDEPDATLCNMETRFDLASVSKCIGVGSLVFQSIDEGVLDLQDPLSCFWNVPKDKQNITIQQILTHTAGFSTGIHLWRTAALPSDCVRTILNQPLVYEPGTQELYCCAGFILLGKLLEMLYHEPLNVLVQKRVLNPLKTEGMGYCPTGENIAATERQSDGTLLCGVVHDENARFLSGVSGNAGLFADAADVGKYVRMLYRGGIADDGTKLFSKAVFREACRNYTPGMAQNRGLAFYLPSHVDGYAGELFPEGSIGHTGFTGTSFTLDLQSGIYVVLLANRVCPKRDNTKMTRLRRVVHNAVYAAINP